MKSNFIHLAALLGTASTVAAHGYVTKIEVAGTEYPGYSPDTGVTTGLIAWSTDATDQGYVQDLHSPDIICHRGAVPGDISTEVPAGGTVTVTWSTWPEDHRGPVLDYLANCNGECTNVDKTTLKFFKIDEGGYGDNQWATNKLIQQEASWDITIPQDLKAGNYVLRHEIIALHSTTNGPQPYPQCVNLKVTSGGTSEPAGVPGIELYKGDEPGLNMNIWDEKAVPNYQIPGPKLFAAGDAGDAEATGSSTSSSAGASTSSTSSTGSSTYPTSASSTPAATLTPGSASSTPLFTSPSSQPTVTGPGTGTSPSPGTSPSKTACTAKSSGKAASATGTGSGSSHLAGPSSTPARCGAASNTSFVTISMTTTSVTTEFKTVTTTKFRTDTVSETETVTDTVTPTTCGFGQSTVTVSANC
ncbi:uncharacterized protein APUU_31322A [Aspergillus puulaauensis]|uniref:Auxiliary Activity family 9 catalytic domain-containing protein n=1 Tax=Aspergillus puulaauensis TaxID=1220207 RepID=A0A7R8ALV9_9EURO|nr:uncharacterized protein APUU_31322A [Aspergillus puulaauensis]BCS23097.1 hypothetical protein APUU_31322A [Aspergillus puulaauensis]